MPITLAAVGDIMLGSDWPQKKLPTRSLLLPAAKLLQAADIAFGNLEGPLCDGGTVTPGKANAQHSYAFRTPTRLGNWLKEAGFDVLSVANNHASDFQALGRAQTSQTLARLGILSTGADANPTTLRLQKNQTVRFLGFATNSISPNLNDIAAAQQLVRAAKTKSNLVVVSFHGGAEGAAYQHVARGSEQFYGESRGDLRRFAHAVIDAGADLVIGHGPHVLRALELYKSRLIAYSLGNFATYGRMSLRGPCGVTCLLSIAIGDDGALLSGQIHSMVQRGEGGPQPDPKRQAISVIKNLSQSDFGKNAPQIDATGRFGPR
jgi:poly-gamma-glutamate capsule biosynthesis protein CapA/YwtB (metallophosphatase superfamily)